VRVAHRSEVGPDGDRGSGGKTGMTGTASQVEWGEQIRALADAEFSRVSHALQSVAIRQTGEDQAETRALIAILEEKRAEVMANESAGYFVREWRELNDQVRQMIAADSRYDAIRVARAARRAQAAAGEPTL
jgi:hypothetical protein